MGDRVRQKEFRDSRSKAGLCPDCPVSEVANRPTPGSKYCYRCLVQRRRRSRQFAHKRRQSGLCPRCGKSLPEGCHAWYCPECREKHAERRRLTAARNRVRS